MYIQPNSDITLYAGIPCTTSYDFAPWFANIDSQKAYFESITTKGIFHEYSFIRNEPNKIKLGRPVTETAYRWQYMSFRNTAYGENRIFYAFITNIDYLNDNCIIITFEIDVLQTYMFDVQFNECFIERNCIPKPDDIAGYNVEPENYDLGDMTADDGVHPTVTANILQHISSPWCVLLFTTLDASAALPDTWEGGIIGGVYSGVNCYAFPTDANGISQLNTWLQAAHALNLDDNLVSACLFPSKLLPDSMDDVYTETILYPFQLDTYNNYTPRNKKLFTYPYVGIVVYDGSGRSKVYHPELFDNYPNELYAEFTLCAAISPSPQIALFPNNYAGSLNKTTQPSNIPNKLKNVPVNLNAGFYMSDLPQVTLPVASLIASLSSGITQNILHLPSQLMGGLFGAITGGKIGGALGVVTALKYDDTSILGKNVNTEHHFYREAAGGLLASSAMSSAFEAAAQLGRGETNSFTQNLSVQFAYRDFYIQTQSLRVRKVMKLDNYFDEYGYTINDVQVPDVRTNTREKQYIKTLNCNVTGLCPASVLRVIEDIFNHGIKLIRNPEAYTTDATQLLGEQRR